MGTSEFKNLDIENRIFTIRGKQVMIDRDLGNAFGVETKVLNQSAKRNIDRFPISFRFQLTNLEKEELVTNCDRFRKLKHSTSNPFAFTEQGVAMLSAVLNSETAVTVSIQIINAFVEMRKIILTNSGLFQRIDKIELKQIEADQKFERLFRALENRNLQPDKGIFFENQIFDAFTFISDIIRSAKKSIVIIDNFLDDTVFTLLVKRNSKVSVICYTKNISKQLQLDLEKHNLQYPPIELKILSTSHDRFLIIDNVNLFHLGASLKDLGKKWFAFSRMDTETSRMLQALMNSKK